MIKIATFGPKYPRFTVPKIMAVFKYSVYMFKISLHTEFQLPLCYILPEIFTSPYGT